VAKNITTSEYLDVLNHTLLPEGQRLFGKHGISNWVLQQDNDPSHGGAGPIVKKWTKGHACSVSLLEKWPPNSPDLSPIENLWGVVAGKVNASGCTIFDEFSRVLQQQWQAVPQSMLINLVKSVPQRIKECINSGGDKTPH
jgi:hypothetical protein